MALIENDSQLEPAMRLLQPLRIKAVALLWAGLSTSAVGDQLGIVAITWIAVGTMGAAAGYLTALQAGLTVVAALLIGRWTDGRNERWLMIAADLVRALALTVTVAVWLTTGRVPAVALVGGIVVLAVGQAVFRPSVQAIMPVLSPSPALLPSINGLLDATDRLARLCGPGLIALVAAWVPVVHFLTLDAVSFLVSAGAVIAIGTRATQSRRPQGPVGRMLLRGFSAMMQQRLLRYLLRTSALNNGAWYAAMFLGVPLVLATRGSGVAAFGTVIACYGVTNLGANLVVGSRPPLARPGRLILSGILTNGTGVALMGLSAAIAGAPNWGLYAGAMIAGAGGPMNDIPRMSLMQTALPKGDVAAAFRAWMVASASGVLMAMLIAPTLFATIGAAWGVVVLGSAIVVGSLAGFAAHVDAPVQAAVA
jgi:MFS transporter, DHA3 family, macrolide efflux protein